MRPIRLLLLSALLLAPLAAQPEAQQRSLTVAAAADLKFAMDEIISAFKSAHPDDSIDVTYGSSGKLYAQIQQGAPFDLFFSADIAFARDMVKAGLAASDVKPYAVGRLVLWSATLDASRMTMASLADPAIAHVAIANPKHAPYGRRAEEAIRAAGAWTQVESKLVFGENIAQAAQFVQTGNAQVGVIALSLAVSPELASRGGYWLVPAELHEPLQQGFVITKRADGNALALRFASYMESAPARAVMKRYGFVLPGERLGR